MDQTLIFIGFVLSLHRVGASIPANNDKFCNINLKHVMTSRSAENSGFHRDLKTDIELTFEDATQCSVCHLMLVEAIPSGMYVDLDQTKAAEPFGGPKVISSEQIDVEKPAYLSPEHTILVYVPHPMIIANSKHHNIHVDMPVHLRYHRPSADPEITSAMVQLQHPNLMIRCQGSNSRNNLKKTDLYQAPCDSHNTSMCAWQDLKYDMDNGKPLQFRVPAGQQSHMVFVSLVTIAATIAGVIALLWAMYKPMKSKVT